MIKLSQEIVDRCVEYGKRMVDEYGRGLHGESRKLAIMDAENNPVMQADAKMAECVFASENGLDPAVAVKWDGAPQLDGIDIMVGGVGVDVKQTVPGGRYLIWSAGKQDKLESKKFHAFVLVLCRVDEAREGESVGWMSRLDFIAKHRVSPPPGFFHPGTLWMPRGELHPMSSFPRSPDPISGPDISDREFTEMADRMAGQRKPDHVAQSMWDAFVWLRKYHPERLAAWLDRHPDFRSG